MGRDEDYENSCEYAATGNHQVKRSQVARRRFGTRQLTVTHHANGGESDAGKDHQRGIFAHVAKQIDLDGQAEGEKEEGPEDGAPIPTIAVEGQNERAQVDGERKDPQKWDGCEILAEKVGGGEEHGCGAGA